MSDIAIHAEEILRTRASLNSLYAKHTGQSVDVIEKTLERDHFKSPEQSKEFGLIDDVVERRPEESSES